jgi:ribosomal protein S18 acetylase RimI-like enzyme
MYIDQMCVIEAHRFKGLGTQLMGKIQEFCKQHDYKRIELGVWADNMNAINFYKKIGFEDYLIHMCLAI